MVLPRCFESVTWPEAGTADRSYDSSRVLKSVGECHKTLVEMTISMTPESFLIMSSAVSEPPSPLSLIETPDSQAFSDLACSLVLELALTYPLPIINRQMDSLNVPFRLSNNI